jgi:DNA-binding NarL/FixJ family response regulator
MVETLRSLQTEFPDLRVLVLLPGEGREYRAAAWRAGACACVPRDRIDPEWLQAMLCVMSRAKEREMRIRRQVA